MGLLYKVNNFVVNTFWLKSLNISKFGIWCLKITYNCLYLVWFTFAKFHVTCHFWNLCVYWIMLNYVHWIFSKKAQQSYFEIVFEIIYLLNCKYIEKYMVFICNLKPRWRWFSFLVFKAVFFPPYIEVHMLIKPSW